MVASIFMHLNHEKKWIYGALILTVVGFLLVIFLPLFTIGNGIGTPTHAAHAVADEKHSDLFVPLLDRFISNRERALKAADDALELFKLYHLGVAEEMEKSD